VESLSCTLPVWRYVHFYSNKNRGFCLRTVFCTAKNNHRSTKFLKKTQMLVWILRLIYLIFLVCKTRHKFVYIYNLYIFYLYILYTDDKKIFLCIRLRDLSRNDIGITGSLKKLRVL